MIYRHGDQVDSSVFTNNNGTDKSRRYSAYGKTRSGAVDTAYTYTDQFEDGTGLYYYNARYYDPNIGLFISPDTWTNPTASIVNEMAPCVLPARGGAKITILCTRHELASSACQFATARG